MHMTRWNIAERPNPASVRELEDTLGVEEFAASVLAARGYTADTAAEFLESESLPDPFLLKDMDKAVEAVEKAIEDDGLILIYGDYDADGVCSTAILYTYLRDRGARVNFYIPKRFGEGYGLNKGVLATLHEKYSPALILTVDNGVTAVEEVAFCNSVGMPVVVTDHHQPTETLPDAAAVVDPHRADGPDVGRCLCGAGVALMLVCALERDYESAAMYADLAAIGTIGDVVPLTGENRVIVRMGLEKMREHDQTGIEALRQVAHLVERDEMTAEQVAFGLVPRINAAGRMGSATVAVRLLISEDEEKCAEYARQVQTCNDARKETEAGILEMIDRRLAAEPALLRQRILFLSGEGWHCGVVGIVAARMVERYGKPCVLVSVENGVARASARSIDGFNIFEAFCAAREHLERFGGHAMAGGFTTDAGRLADAEAALQQYACAHFLHMPPPVRRVDLEVRPSALTLENIDALGLLEPCGTGNEHPCYLLRGLRLDAVWPMGQGKHIRVKLSAGGESLTCVWFGMSPEELPFQPGAVVDAVCSAAPNEYNGEVRLSVKIAEMRPSGFDFEQFWFARQVYGRMQRRETLTEREYALALPERTDIAGVYRALRTLGAVPEDYDALALRMPQVPYCRLRACVEVLRELKLILIENGRISVPVNPQRVNIEDSRVLRRLRTLRREG